MNSHIILDNIHKLDLIERLLEEVIFDKETHEVIIRTYRKNRSVEQNAYYWKLITIISEELGYSKEDTHELYKEKFLINIMIRDNEEFSKTIERVNHLKKKGFELEYKQIKKQIISLISTKECNTKQMTEYIDNIIKSNQFRIYFKD